MINTKTGPRDVFLQLLAMATLYLSAIQFGVLLFQYVNRFFPDALLGDTHRFAMSGPLRWALATLVIVFPVYVGVSYYLARELERNPEKRELRTRKWLTYLTLFIAAIVVIGDLVAVVYNFLQGELTIRFILKALTILLIAVVVFVYYLWNIRRETRASADPHMKWFVWSTVTVVGIAVMGGFFIAGSPQSERMRRFDDRRVQDLSNIQWRVMDYYHAKSRIPATIDELHDDISGYVAPRDPQSNTAYEYSVNSPLQFTLCANFRTETTSDKSRTTPQPYYGPYGEISDNWNHNIGRVCFDRTIDPERYPPEALKTKPAPGGPID